MKRTNVVRVGGALRNLALVAMLTGVVVAACTDEPLDLRPTLGAGSSGKAGSNTSGSANNNDNGGEGGAGNEGGAGTPGGKAGSGGKGGGAGMGGSSGGTGGTTTLVDCGNHQVDAGEQCDDGNKLSGDGCSYNCQSSCELCERDMCPTLAQEGGTALGDAYARAWAIAGDAAQGAAVGTPRVDLLRNLLKCVYEKKCTVVIHDSLDIRTSQIVLTSCACSNPDTSGNPQHVAGDCKIDDKIIKGPCYDAMKEAAEADTSEELFARISNNNYAVGRVVTLLQACDSRYCPTQCIPTEAAAAVCPNQTCGTGGSGGSGGSGGTPGEQCGNNVKEGFEECEPPNSALCSNDCKLVASPTCLGAEAAVPACSLLAQACLTSPGAATLADQAACYDVQECVFSTGCGSADALTKCFCGDVPVGDCPTAPESGAGAPNGSCAAKIRAGMGAGATNAQVMSRFTDASYPAGAGLKRLACQETNNLRGPGQPCN